MPKPFALTFRYTPKWKGNQSRTPDEQVTVTLKDFSERVRIAFREQIAADIPDFGDKSEAASAKATLDYQKKDLDVRMDAFKQYFVSISGLQVECDDQGGLTGVREVKTAEDVIKYCPDLASEISLRLFNGPDAEELKNSR